MKCYFCQNELTCINANEYMCVKCPFELHYSTTEHQFPCIDAAWCYLTHKNQMYQMAWFFEGLDYPHKFRLHATNDFRSNEDYYYNKIVELHSGCRHITPQNALQKLPTLIMYS
jgi:hypothetical protein